MNHSEAVAQMAADRYLLDEMGPDARDEFEEHLFDCPDCAMDVRAGDAFIREAKRQLPEMVAADEAKARSSKQAVAGGKEKKDWFARLRPVWSRPAWLIPVGAPAFALLLGVVAYQNLVTMPALEQAANEPLIVDANATPLRGASRGAEQEHQKLTASRKDGLSVPLDLSGDGSYASYAFELTGPGGKLAWSRMAAVPGPRIVLGIPGAKLASGTYTLAVSGVAANGSRDPLHSYVFDVNVKQ